jgi:DNA polymerase I-like protein with 3'-5' exonuclease and polymerase domains
MQTFPPLPDWCSLEHQVAQILTEQEQHGWYFDERAAWKLASTLQKELEETKEVLRNRHPFVQGSTFNPKRNNKTQGYYAGCESVRLKELNPTSRDHIAWILTTFYGWTPTLLTTTGKAVIDEIILTEIASGGISIAAEFAKCLDITKKLGMISEGTNAWLKLCTTASRIHHHCSVGCATFRMSHKNPNLAQVPSDGRFRELFKPTPGQVMVGADLSGIELRMLAHYLARYDSGRYADILLNGDIHQVNADKIGISRKQVKTVTYAFLYGAGDVKIGKSFDSSLSDKKAKAKGSEIRKAYVSAIDGLGDLLAAVKSAGDRGFVKAIDQRKILVDSSHKALNYLLQGSAAVLAKRWMLINQQTIEQTKLCCSQLAFVHDELQFECDPEHAKDLSTSLVYSAAAAGEFYNLRIPIAAESKIGKNWSEVH